MIPLSTRPVRFVVPWREDDPDAPVYYIRPGNVVERAAFEAEMAGEYRAGRVYGWDVRDALVAAIVGALPDGEERQRIIDLVHAEYALDDGEALQGEEQAVLDRAREFAAAHWPAYRTLIAQSERRGQFLPLHAFRRFVVGWEGLDVPFKAGLDELVDLAAVAAVPEIEMAAAGGRAFGLLHAGHHAGNSEPVSPSAAGQGILKSDGTSPAAGGSKVRSGRRTRS